MIDAAVNTFKHTLRDLCKDFDTEPLTPALAEQVTGALKTALSCAGVAGVRTLLEGYEADAPSVLINETLYRFKQESLKRLLTPWGQMDLSRTLYQADPGVRAILHTLTNCDSSPIDWRNARTYVSPR